MPLQFPNFEAIPKFCHIHIVFMGHEINQVMKMPLIEIDQDLQPFLIQCFFKRFLEIDYVAIVHLN